MLKDYYQQELYKIKELARDFAKHYPVLAPLLGERGDPDTERLLEGFAFLSGQLQARMDNNLPQVYAGLAQLFYPQILRPYPSATTMQFQASTLLGKPIAIPAETTVKSITLENQNCLFRTTHAISVEPRSLSDVKYDTDTLGHTMIALQFELLGVKLNAWNASDVVLHLPGEWESATQLYHTLLNDVDHLVLKAANTPDCILPAKALRIHQDAFDVSLYPQPTNANNAFRLLQEYFIFPRKFLYVELTQLASWLNRSDATQFRIELHLKPQAVAPKTTLTADHIRIHCIPAVNISESLAEPFLLNYRLEDYRLESTHENNPYHQIFDLQQVTGYQQGLATPIEYQRLFFEKIASPHYEVHYRHGVSTENWDYFLSFASSDFNDENRQQTISSRILICNGKLPEHLLPGEINQATSNTPERVTFKNIDLPSRYVPPKMGADFLWQVQGLLTLNYVPFLDAARLNTLFQLFSPPVETQSTNFSRKGLQGLERFTIDPCERLVYGEALTGQAITLVCNGNWFIGNGDLYLFGQVLWQFFNANTPIGSFYTLRLINSAADDIWTWEPILTQAIRQQTYR